MPDPIPNNQSEPEDIFSSVEPTKPPKAIKKEALKETAEMPIQEPVMPSSLPKGRKILGIAILIVIVVLLAGAGIFVFGSDYFKKNSNENENKNVPPVNNIENVNVPVIVNANSNVSPVNQVIDSDHDGLSDEEENNLGTNPKKTDTDSDELFDRDEVKVYKTDPKNPDTDGDGIVDGQEVKQGYNPNGQGKLIDLKNINR